VFEFERLQFRGALFGRFLAKDVAEGAHVVLGLEFMQEVSVFEPFLYGLH
jgi:hypothetical protein